MAAIEKTEGTPTTIWKIKQVKDNTSLYIKSNAGRFKIEITIILNKEEIVKLIEDISTNKKDFSFNAGIRLTEKEIAQLTKDLKRTKK